MSDVIKSNDSPHFDGSPFTHSLWSRTTKNPYMSTGACARLLAPLARSLAPPCSLHLLCFAHSFARSHTHSRARGKSIFSMKWTRRFHTVSTHCAPFTHRKPIWKWERWSLLSLNWSLKGLKVMKSVESRRRWLAHWWSRIEGLKVNKVPSGEDRVALGFFKGRA